MEYQISIRNRLLQNFVLIILLFVCSGGLTLYGLYSLGTFTDTIYRHPLVVSNASLRAAVHMTRMHLEMKDFVLTASNEHRLRILARELQEERSLLLQLDLVRDNILGAEGEALEQETRQLVSDWRPIRAHVAKLMDTQKTAEAISITQNESARHVAKMEAKMLELTTYARTKATGFKQEAERRQHLLEKVTLFITGLSVVLSVWIAILATRRVGSVHSRLRAERARLEKALAEIKTLRGIIPVCSNCRQIRDDEGIWKAMEQYLDEHLDASVSHGICPDCLQKLYPELVDSVNAELALQASGQRDSGIKENLKNSGGDSP